MGKRPVLNKIVIVSMNKYEAGTGVTRFAGSAESYSRVDLFVLNWSRST